MDQDVVCRKDGSESRNIEEELKSMGLDKALLHICPLVDEANIITRCIKPEAEIVFELHVLEQIERPEKRITTSGNQEIAICCFHRPSSNTTCRFQAFKERSRGIAQTLHLKSPVRESSQDDTKADSLIYLWSLEKFLTRLGSFRDVYDMAFTHGVSMVREKLEEAPHEDPWREVGPNDLFLQNMERGEGYSAGEANATSTEVTKLNEEPQVEANEIKWGKSWASSSLLHPSPFDTKSAGSSKSAATLPVTFHLSKNPLDMSLSSGPFLSFAKYNMNTLRDRPLIKLHNFMGGGAVNAPLGTSVDNSRYSRMECVSSTANAINIASGRPSLKLRDFMGGGAVNSSSSIGMDSIPYNRMECFSSTTVNTSNGLTKEVQHWRLVPQDYSAPALRATTSVRT